MRKDNCFDITFSAIYVSQQFGRHGHWNAQIPKAQIPAYKVFNLTGDWYLRDICASDRGASPT